METGLIDFISLILGIFGSLILLARFLNWIGKRGEMFYEIDEKLKKKKGRGEKLTDLEEEWREIMAPRIKNNQKETGKIFRKSWEWLGLILVFWGIILQIISMAVKLL